LGCASLVHGLRQLPAEDLRHVLSVHAVPVVVDVDVFYPERCANGHEWSPGLIMVAWQPCECGPAAAEREHGPGHLVVHCQAPGCRSAWYQPRHERR
jgi:hypothetical protein